MKHFLTLSILVALIVFSCKKKDDPAPANAAGTSTTQSTTTGTTGGSTTGGATTGGSTTGGSTTGGSTTGGSTTGGSTTGGTSGSTTIPTFGQEFDGLLTIRTLTDATTPSIKLLTEADAFFSQSPVDEIIDSLGVNAGQVLLNSDPLLFDQKTKSYFLGTVNSFSQSKWNVAGGNNFPGFSFDASFAFPVFHNPDILPETISRSAGVTIAFNVSNITFGTLLFTVNQTTFKIETGMGFGSNNTTLHITPDFIELIGNTDSAVLSLTLENAVNLNVNGKNIIIKKESVFKQMVFFKP